MFYSLNIQWTDFQNCSEELAGVSQTHTSTLNRCITDTFHTHTLTFSLTHTGSYPWRQALLKGVADGQAAVVEVADELRVDGATELR